MSAKRGHPKRDDLIRVRIPEAEKLEATCHAAAQGELLSEFVRRAMAGQIERDRVFNAALKVRAAVRNGVWIDEVTG